jgi:hypothetical protein
MAIALSGSLVLTGSLTTSGNIVAQTLVVSTISSSVEYSSGSNIFGNSTANTQTFTGSVNITGSVGINTGAPAYTLDVNGTGRFLNTSDHNLALDSTGRFSSLDFKNNGTLKSQLFWDNTNANLNLTNPSGVGLSIAAGAGAATFASSVSASQFNASSKYAWGTAANGTTGQIATDGTNNYLDYIGNLYFRGAAASNNLIIFTSGGAATFTAASTFQGEASNGGTINIGDTAAYRGIITYTGASNTTLSIKNSYDNAGAAINFILRSAGTPVTALSLLGSGAATFASSVTAGSDITLSNSGGSYANWYVGSYLIGRIGDVTTNDMYYDSTFGGNHYFRTGTGGTTSPTTKFTILQGGNVGIGITSPTQQLEVQNGSSGTTIKASNTAGGYIQMGVSSNAASVPTISYTNTLNVLGTVYFSGSVGIGTSSPNAPLDVVSATSSTSGIQQWSYNSAPAAYKLQLNTIVSSGLVKYSFDLTNNSTSYINNLVLDRGSVGIGTSSPVTTLQVSGQAQFGDAASMATFSGAPIKIRTTTTGSIAMTYSAVKTWQMGINSSGNFLITDFDSSADRLVIGSTGNVGIGTTSPQAVLHQAGSRVFTNVGSFYGRQEIMYVQSAFTNPTTNIITVTTGSAYDQTFVKVRVFHNSYSAGYGVESVGYAMQYCNSSGVLQGQTSSSMSVVGQLGGSSNVGTLSWSGTTLQYTPNRITNYDGYAIIVEWSGAPNATYPVLNTAIFD